MVKKNYIYPIIILFIIHLCMFSNVVSFPFYNLQSKLLNNGNLFIVHKSGIDICDKDLNIIIRKEIIFTYEEEITIDKMINVIIKQFEDGYITCLINEYIYIFDDLGNFLYKSGNINNGKIVNHYSLNIKDKYHYFIGIINDESLNIYYYEYNRTSNETILVAESGEIKKTESSWFGFVNTDYQFQNSGLNCHIMNNINKGEVLVCFFIICQEEGECYWLFEFLNVIGNSIIEHQNYTYIRRSFYGKVDYFKVEVNSYKIIALIYSYLNIGDDQCFYYNIYESEFVPQYFYLGDIYSYGTSCLKNNYQLKVNYYPENEQFVFSCLVSNVKIIYVIFYFDNNNLIKESKDFIKSDICMDFNSYDIFPLNENEYFIISDYICNKSLDSTTYISNEKEEENIEGEESKIEEENIEGQIKEKEEEKYEEKEEKEEEEKEKEEKEYECKLEKCSKCDIISESQNLCNKCNELKGYYPLKSNILKNEISNSNNLYIDCFNEKTKPSNYYFNNLEKNYEACYETCAKCEYGGDKINNNCTECDFGFIFLPLKSNTFNCNIKCPYYFYYTSYGQYKCSKLTICPEEYYLLIREKEQCIENCKIDDEYKYQYNGECYKECPNNYNANNDYICLDNNINICSLSQREILIKNEIITEEEIENLAKIYAKEFFYTDNHISLFNYTNYEIAIYKNLECISYLSLNIPSVDLGNCYEQIKEKYVIEENLILAVVSQKIQGMVYPLIVNFFVFSPYNGNNLEILNLCENDEVIVQEDISMKIEDKEKYNYIKYLTQHNVDVFNLSSDFYTDICYYFDSPINKDIALKDRIKLFYPNITLCENGCNIKGINSTSMKAECECKINNLINNNILSNNAWYKNQIHDIEDWLTQINIEILKCGSNLFKYRKITSYIGSFIILSLSLIEIVLSVIYFILSINPIKHYLFTILNIFTLYSKKSNNSPPKKSKKVQFSNSTNIENKNKRKKNKYNANKTEISKDIYQEKKSNKKRLITSN